MSGGRLLGDRYELRRVLADGGMGRVWHAYDTLLGRAVAVKVLRGQPAGDARFLHRFRTEARHAANLADPNIAAVHDYGEGPAGDGGEYVAYLVMELVDGEPLSDLLRRHPGGLGVHRTLGIVRQTASALAAAHAAGVVHRDVKPANIVLTSTGRVKLTDFGIAWSAANPRLTDTGDVMGTAHYLAPEQVAGEKATATSDVYSLGVVAYECLAGRRPFEGENSVTTALRHLREVPDPLPPGVPDDVRELVARAMAKTPAERFRDGGALRAAIDARRAPVASAPADQQTVLLWTEPPRRRPSRLLAGVAAVAALVLLCLVVGGVLAGRSVGPPAAATRSAAEPSSGATGRPTSRAPVHLAPDELIGRPVTEVQSRLTALGLQVALRSTGTSAVPADAVVRLDPAGDLAPGGWVTLTYATAPVATPSAGPPSTTAPAAASSTAPPTAVSSSTPRHPTRPGRGNGHGKHG